MSYGTCPCAEMIANAEELPASGELHNQLLELEPGIWTCMDCEAEYDTRPARALLAGARLILAGDNKQPWIRGET